MMFLSAAARAEMEFLFDVTALNQLVMPKNNGWLDIKALNSPELIREIEGPRTIEAVALSPDGGKVAIAGGALKRNNLSGVLAIWDISTGKSLLEIRRGTGSMGSVSFSPDGSRILTSNSRETILWDVATGAEVATLGEPQIFGSRIKFAAFNQDGSIVFTREGKGNHRETILWSETTRKEIMRFEERGYYAGKYALMSPDGSILVTLGSDAADVIVRYLNIPSGLFGLGRKEIKLSHESVMSASFSPDGLRLATAGLDGHVRVWDPRNGLLLLDLKGHWEKYMKTGSCPWIRSVSYSPDGSKIIDASDDGTSIVWDAVTGDALRILEGGAGALFLPDGIHAVTIENHRRGGDRFDDRGARIRIWQVFPSKQELKELQEQLRKAKPAESVVTETAQERFKL